jgi:hypothetical protein
MPAIEGCIGGWVVVGDVKGTYTTLLKGQHLDGSLLYMLHSISIWIWTKYLNHKDSSEKFCHLKI